MGKASEFWRRADVARRVQQDWGAWLGQWDWSWFATLTFRDPVGIEQGNDRWTEWAEKLTAAARRPVGWIRCTEFQRHRGGIPHYHALLTGVADQPRRFWWANWKERCGFARILPFDPALGATCYVGKYLLKSEGHIELRGLGEPEPREDLMMGNEAPADDGWADLLAPENLRAAAADALHLETHREFREASRKRYARPGLRCWDSRWAR